MGRRRGVVIAVLCWIFATVVAPAGARPDDPQSLTLPEVAAAEVAEAQAALDRDDPQAAIEILRPLLEDSPSFDAARGVLGVALIMQGDIDAGRGLIDALPDDPASFHAVGRAVSVLEETDIDRALLTPYRERALYLARLAADQNRDDPAPYLYIATMASRLNNMPELRRATAVLIEQFPDEEQGHFLTALVAASDADWETHDAELLEAERLGMPAEIIDEARAQATRVRTAAQSSRLRSWLIGGGLLLAVLAIWFYRRRSDVSPPDQEIADA